MESFEFVDIDGIKVAVDRTVVSPPILEAMARKHYEHVEARVGAQLLADSAVRSKQIIVEAGAGLGYVGSHLFRSGKVSRIYSYEANPQLIPLIRETHRANGVVSDVRHAMVACTRSGATDFYVPRNFWGASSRPNPQAEKVTCPKIALEDVIGEASATILLVDIEGGEVDLFSQAQNLGTVERILIEIHQTMIGRAGIQAFFRDMNRLGFVYDQKYSTGKVLLLQRVDIPLPGAQPAKR